MNLAELLIRMRRYDRNAEVIFDAQEPVGRATDLVMPRRGWWRRGKYLSAKAAGVPRGLDQATNH